MNINPSFIHLPPYISTSWNQVAALYTEESVLIVQLIDGGTISLSHLSPEILKELFAAHSSYLEQQQILEQQSTQALKNPQFLTNTMAQIEGIELPFRLGISSLDGIHSVMQHNPEQANGPELPPEILQKIAAIAKIVAPQEEVPKPEPHCHCMHCQIARAISQEISPQAELEVEVSEKDLHFEQWQIKQTGDKLFSVFNDTEQYSVFLGDPVGCTCGQPGCAHIVAVLKT